MKEEVIEVSVFETHIPTLRNLTSFKGEDVSRHITPHERMMRLANERAGVSDNLTWHGWRHHFSPDKEIHYFYKLNLPL